MYLVHKNWKSKKARMGWRLKIYTPTYLHTYIHTYVRTYVRTYIHTYIHTYVKYSHLFAFQTFVRKTSPKQKFPINQKHWGLCQGTIWRVAFLPSWGADIFFRWKHWFKMMHRKTENPHEKWLKCGCEMMALVMLWNDCCCEMHGVFSLTDRFWCIFAVNYWELQMPHNLQYRCSLRTSIGVYEADR